MSETSLTLFTTDLPAFYLLDQVYDSITNPTGTIIPRPNSLVLDPNNKGLLQRVVSVNPTTRNSTYGPVYTSLLSPTTPDLNTPNTNDISIIDYGNSRFYLFYDKAETPTKLNIDKKVVILGDDAVDFEISKYDSVLQKYTPISLYFDTDGVYRGTRIPLVTIGSVSNAKIPTNCHTTMPINNNETYHMFIYDYSGTQCGSIKLFSRQAIVNNTLADTLMIEDFKIEATQMDSNGLYLFPEQDPKNLVITPRVVYNDGTSRSIGIDNTICHLYGLENFVAAYPGQSVELLIKYFLQANQQAVGDTLKISGSTRYLMREVTLTVKDPGTNEYTIKILTVPTYLPSAGKYALLFFMYVIGDTIVRNITQYVNVSSSFDGRLMGVDQSLMLSLRIRDIFPEALSDFVYQQPLVITLAPFSFYERYILRDSIGDTYGIYGADSPILSRPVLYYDHTVSKYFIPTTKFTNSVAMLEAFYYKARPLYDRGWLTSPMEPTHFTIRNAVNGMLLLSAPIAISAYQQGFSLVNVDQQDALLGTNCIVEFLRFDQGKYQPLFGAPTDCYPGTYI